MPLTSQPTSLQRRSGTRASAVDAGSVTEDTQHKEPGRGFVKSLCILCFCEVLLL